MSDKLTNESISRLVAKRDIFGDDLGNFEFLEDYVKLNESQKRVIDYIVAKGLENTK